MNSAEHLVDVMTSTHLPRCLRSTPCVIALRSAASLVVLYGAIVYEVGPLPTVYEGSYFTLEGTHVAFRPHTYQILGWTMIHQTRSRTSRKSCRHPHDHCHNINLINSSRSRLDDKVASAAIGKTKFGERWDLRCHVIA